MSECVSEAAVLFSHAGQGRRYLLLTAHYSLGGRCLLVGEVDGVVRLGEIVQAVLAGVGLVRVRVGVGVGVRAGVRVGVGVGVRVRCRGRPWPGRRTDLE